MKRNKIEILLGTLALLISFSSAFYLNIPTSNNYKVSFKSSYNDETVTLKGTFYEVKNAKYAVVVCPGYSCDRQKWRPFADLFVSNGYSTFLFDYSGQGESNGKIGFDNAKTDNIPLQIDDAIQKVKELTHLDDRHIILVGHSMGGRAILRLLFDYNDPNAITSIQKRNIENVILLSPEVNYEYNAQASLFAGTSDKKEYPWNKLNANSIKGTNIYLYGSIHDDIVSDTDVLEIYKHLGAINVPNKGMYSHITYNSNGSKLTIGITKNILHSYMMYSSQMAQYVNEALSAITGIKSHYEPLLMNLVYVSWITGLFGLWLLFKGLIKKDRNTYMGNLPIINDMNSFLVFKAIYWLPATLIAIVICTFTILMPFGSPVMNTPYMCFIAGYGIMMVLAYRKGKFRGSYGKLPSIDLYCRMDHILPTFSISILTCFITWYILNATMYHLYPLNIRLFYLCFSTILMSIGYYISSIEKDMLNKANATIFEILIYNCIQYVPLFLLVILYFVLKSYSGMIGQIQNMIFMYIFAIPIGQYFSNQIENRFIGSLITSFIFQSFMITSAALIAMF